MQNLFQRSHDFVLQEARKAVVSLGFLCTKFSKGMKQNSFMKIFSLSLCLFFYPFVILAQQPQWELFARGLYGIIAVDPTNSNVVYIGSRDSGKTGMWKTTDGGRNWTLYKNGWGIGSPTDILIDPTNPQVILACGGPFVGVQKSVDGGQNWFRADSGLAPDHHGYDVWSLALDNQRRIFYLADQGIFTGVARSMNGTRWQLADPNSPFPALDLAIDERTGVLYAGSGNGVWKSLNWGSSWIQISNGLNVNTILHVTKLKQNNTLYAATFRGIYKSINGGENWFSVNDTITSKLSFQGGLVVAEKDTNTIYAGAYGTLNPTLPGGVYLSRNGGNSWKLYNLGLPDSVLDLGVANLFLDNKTGALYANIISVFPEARSESNTFRLRNAVTTSVHSFSDSQLPERLILHSFPNPFKSQTLILYSVPRTGQVVFRVFDILGKEVVTLLNEQRSPGEYKISWDGKNNKGGETPSGIYFIQLKTRAFIETRKMVLMR